MSRQHTVVVGASTGSDDDLLLPRTPGVFRRFWARHPRLTDVLVAAVAFLLSGPGVAVRAGMPAPSLAETWVAIGSLMIGCVALLWRRRHPLPVFVIAFVPSLVLSPALVPVAHPLLAFAAYALAVYRSARSAWIAFGASGVVMVGYAIATFATGAVAQVYAITGAVSGIVTLLIGTLVGVNVGNRRRYLEALIDRSRQLLRERDQQAQLAAAAERTRIAREMHDIVSHSLTVVVALSEGAVAATDPERARQASRGSAETARGALREMRAMLGVLRDGDDEASPLEPLAPVDPAEVVASARRAGFPAQLESTGPEVELPRPVRFALGRVVQEGVTNAMRHAPNASGIRVVVARSAEAVTVDIRNDGAATRPAGPGGFGLRGLRERVEHIGGSLTAGADGPGRFRLHAALPVSNPEATA